MSKVISGIKTHPFFGIQPVTAPIHQGYALSTLGEEIDLGFELSHSLYTEDFKPISFQNCFGIPPASISILKFVNATPNSFGEFGSISAAEDAYLDYLINSKTPDKTVTSELIPSGIFSVASKCAFRTRRGAGNIIIASEEIIRILIENSLFNEKLESQGDSNLRLVGMFGSMSLYQHCNWIKNKPIVVLYKNNSSEYDSGVFLMVGSSAWEPRHSFVLNTFGVCNWHDYAGILDINN